MPLPNATTHLRTWAEINLAALEHNIQVAAAITRAHDCRLCPVIKADAYGLGATSIARTLQKHPAVAMIAVASPAEAIELIDAGITNVPIHLLGPAPPEHYHHIVKHRLVPTLSSLEEAKHLNHLASASHPKPLHVHLKIDTGMGRIGFLPEHLHQFLPDLLNLPALKVSGIATHLPSADEDPAFTHQQITRFHDTLRSLHASAPSLRAHRHAHNSAGLLGGYDLAHCTLARPGLMLHGVSPIPDQQHRLQPTLTLKSHVTLVRNLPAGHSISYGRTYVTQKPTRTATLSIGYGDGYPRHLSGQNTHVLIAGQRCPILGRVTMDQISVDISHLPHPPSPGEEAVLIGTQGSETISTTELAGKAETIPWEILTRLSTRVTKLYF
ncbi:MAG: alanine racemase [Verrucomicrobiota bacterium]